MIFSSVYLITILGNIFFVFLITADLHLHSSMYSLVANLLFIDSFLSIVTTPKLTSNFLKPNKTISFRACVRLFLFLFFSGGRWGWDDAAGVHGLWPLRGHLQATLLLQHHEHTHVHSASDDTMDHWLCAFNKPTSYNYTIALLWTQRIG